MSVSFQQSKAGVGKLFSGRAIQELAEAWFLKSCNNLGL